jgi:HK97 family phage major capsid protein
MDEKKLLELQETLKTHFEKAAAETKANGNILEETRKTIAALQTQVDAIDKKIAAKSVSDVKPKSLIETLKEDEGIQRLCKDRSGRASITLTGKALRDFERKTTIDSAAVGWTVTGVLPIQRVPGIVPDAREVLTVRDLLYAAPTTMQVIDFVKVNARMAIASPQTESSAKAENAQTFTAVSEKVKTIATWIPASRQVLDDFAELANFLDSSLRYAVNLDEEIELLSGDGTGVHLNGLITQATAFSTALLVASAGWKKFDIIARAINQIQVAKEMAASFAVVHPTDWWEMRLTKDSTGQYILGNPQENVAPNLFGLSVVPTTNIAAGTFLVGSGSPACSQIRDRMELAVDISTEHSDFFTKNLVAIRAEKRLALIVQRPGSYITGSFTNSPA